MVELMVDDDEWPRPFLLCILVVVVLVPEPVPIELPSEPDIVLPPVVPDIDPVPLPDDMLPLVELGSEVGDDDIVPLLVPPLPTAPEPGEPVVPLPVVWATAAVASSADAVTRISERMILNSSRWIAAPAAQRAYRRSIEQTISLCRGCTTRRVAVSLGPVLGAAASIQR